MNPLKPLKSVKQFLSRHKRPAALVALGGALLGVTAKRWLARGAKTVATPDEVVEDQAGEPGAQASVDDDQPRPDASADTE